MEGRSPTQGASNLGKGADQNFAPFWPTGPALSNFIKILSLFNTQPNMPRASPALSKHGGQVSYSRGFKFGERGRSKFCPILAYRSGAVKIFIKILILFNTCRAGPLLKGLQIWGKGADQNFAIFGLQVRRYRISTKF